jgi:hypothetical protein
MIAGHGTMLQSIVPANVPGFEITYSFFSYALVNVFVSILISQAERTGYSVI